MRLCMKGQLFYADGMSGPMFKITNEHIDGPYIVIITSHLTGEILARSDVDAYGKTIPGSRFADIGEAAAWAYGYCEY